MCQRCTPRIFIVTIVTIVTVADKYLVSRRLGKIFRVLGLFNVENAKDGKIFQ